MEPSRGSAAPPDSEDAARLLALIGTLAAELHRRPPAGRIHLDADLDRDLGMDSLARVELLSRAERQFAVRLPEHAFAEARTPRDLLRTLAQATAHPGIRSPGRSEPTAPSPALPPTRASAAPDDTSTLIEALEWHAQRHPERIHIRFFADDGDGGAITYRDLLDRSWRYGAALQALGVTKGSPVVLMLQTGEEYFYTFFGVLLAGGIPVPIYPPARASQIEDHIRRQRGIIENCAAAVLVTMPEAQTVARLLRSQAECLRHVVTPAELAASDAELLRPHIVATDLAFLQYTSGSTGQPKGVMLTHANLLANIRAMAAQIGAGPEDVFVSWLPLYHDMGLIGAWLGSLCCAAELVIMSPLAFIARPQRWLWAIHRHRATLSAAPNFGYELCLKRLQDEELRGLDLGSWRCAFNGAEPVSPETLRAFEERFRRYGLKPGVQMPVYGLAECSVGLAFPPSGRGPRIDRVRRDPFLRHGRAEAASAADGTALCFVSSGRALAGHEIRIVDGDHELPEREVGALQFRGPSATRGYYRNPEATDRLIHGDWLDSGDLAYSADGEIYITGRARDIIIYAGRNLYPHEIEEAVGNLPGIRAGRVAAFGARDERLGTERLVVVAETHEQDGAERERLRAEVAGVVATLSSSPPDDVVLAAPGTILKTPSGKVRRAALRERYLRGEIDRPPPPVWRQLLRLALEDVPHRLRRLRRRLYSVTYGLWAHTVFWVVAPVCWLAVVLLPVPGARWRVTRATIRGLAGATGIRVRIEGRENLPGADEACVCVSNHASYLDGALLMLALDHPVGFVAKAELRGNFLARHFLQRLGAEFVERFDARRGMEDLQGLTDRLRQGKALFFFPEGTFTRAPGVRPFRMGAFVAAANAGVPVVPIAVRGSRSLLRSGSWRPSPGEVTITVTPAVRHSAGDVGVQDAWSIAVTLRARARAEILRHAAEPALDEADIR